MMILLSSSVIIQVHCDANVNASVRSYRRIKLCRRVQKWDYLFGMLLYEEITDFVFLQWYKLVAAAIGLLVLTSDCNFGFRRV